MWSYVVQFLALALFPLLLAGYGGHLATLALPEGSKKRRNALFKVWGLAIIGILFFGVSQRVTQRADQVRTKGDEEFRAGVTTKLQAIIDEPNVAKKREAAVVLQALINPVAIPSTHEASHRSNAVPQASLPRVQAQAPVTVPVDPLVQRADNLLTECTKTSLPAYEKRNMEEGLGPGFWAAREKARYDEDVHLRTIEPPSPGREYATLKPQSPVPQNIIDGFRKQEEKTYDDLFKAEFEPVFVEFYRVMPEFQKPGQLPHPNTISFACGFLRVLTQTYSNRLSNAAVSAPNP